MATITSPPTIPDTIWASWESECRRLRRPFVLESGLINQGQTAMACWAEDDQVHFIVDKPLVLALVARRAEFMTLALIQEAVDRYAAGEPMVTVPMPLWGRRIRVSLA